MLYNYVALFAFAILALLVPLGLIAASKAMRKRSRGNPVKNAPWESGEVSVGRARDVENEYLPFFSLFLPFEVVVGILLAWSTVAMSLSFSVDVGMIILAVAASVAAFFGYRMIVGGGLMDSGIPYNEQDFLNAEQEMSQIAQQASKKYNVETNAMFARLEDVTKALSKGMVGWSRKNSVWPMQFGLACCAMELMDFGASRIDAERKGYLLFRGTPRQCDVMIVAGWVTKSIVPRIKRLYEQMADPKYVVAYGECATSGGPWWQSYNIVQGIDQVLPVDVYVVGCPPKPENLFAALMKLQDKIGGKVAGNPERSVSENIRREKAGRV